MNNETIATGGDDILSILDATPASNPTPPASVNEFNAAPKKAFVPGNSGDKKDSPWDKLDFNPVEIDTTKLLRFNRMVTVSSFGEIPEELFVPAREVFAAFAEKGFTLRYNADKKDKLSKCAYDVMKARTEVFMGWPGFNKEMDPKLKAPSMKAREALAFYNKNYVKLPAAVRAIMSAQMHLLLGEELTVPVNAYICYSPDGTESSATKIDYKTTGHISHMIDICTKLDIPVFNLHNPDAVSRLKQYLITLQ